MNIELDLRSFDSVNNAIKKMDAYTEKLKRLAKELPEVLAKFGINGAFVRFSSATYDVLTEFSGGTSSKPYIMVSAVPRENGWSVEAKGKEVCFVEFGAGVHFNGAESYLGTRPPEMFRIGEYGEGHGKQDKWVFGHRPNHKWTYGTQASNALFYTAQEMRRRIEEEARRIMNDD